MGLKQVPSSNRLVTEGPPGQAEPSGACDLGAASKGPGRVGCPARDGWVSFQGGAEPGWGEACSGRAGGRGGSCHRVVGGGGREALGGQGS